MRHRWRWKRALETSESVMKRRPIVSGIDNCHLLRKRQIFNKNFDVQLSIGLNARCDSEDVWNDDGCSYAISMSGAGVQEIIKAGVVVPIDISENSIFDIELINFRAAYMRAPDFT